MPVSLSIENLDKRFNGVPALRGVSLDVAPAELVALLGPSGSGKTTLLRAIAGLEEPEAGRVLFDGVDSGTLSLRDRRIGFVFQHYALFRHLTVFENVAFGLRARPRAQRPAEAEIRSRVLALLELVQLEGYDRRFPSQLSGGQRQRIGIARALYKEVDVLVLDEATSALDGETEHAVMESIKGLGRDLTVLIVAHRLSTLRDCTHVVELANGVIKRAGTYLEIVGTGNSG